MNTVTSKTGQSDLEEMAESKQTDTQSTLGSVEARSGLEVIQMSKSTHDASTGTMHGKVNPTRAESVEKRCCTETPKPQP